MKQFTAMAFAAFVGVLGALLFYYLVFTKPGIEREFGRMDQVRDQAREVGRELEKAAQESVMRTREVFESQAQDQRRGALLAAALAAGQEAKVAVTESYMTVGVWPTSATDIGWGEPAAHANDGARGVALESEGVVRIDLVDAVARGASIRLIPTAMPSTGMVNWRCEVEGYAELSRFAPDCKPASGGPVPTLIGKETAPAPQRSD